MIITLNSGYLLLSSTKINEISTNPGDYLKVEIKGDINCCSSNCGQQLTTETVLTPFITTSKYEFTAGGIKIFPAFFGLTDFIDGVYKFEVKVYEEFTSSNEVNCLFVDVTFKCKVAALLKCIIQENKIKTEKKISTIVHLLHYALVNGSNCGCNCEEMCEVFRGLNDLLKTTNPEIFIDCGC